MKKLGWVGLLVLLLAARAIAEDAARVNGEAIAKEDLDREVARLIKRSGGKYSRTPQVVRFVLNNLINKKLRDQHIKAQGITVTNVDLYEAVKERRRLVQERFGVELEDWVSSQGYDRASFREQLRSELAIKSFGDKVATKEALEKHLAKHGYRFNGEARLVSHIGIRAGKGVRSRKEAHNVLGAIRKQIRSGSDFSEIAEKRSEGPGRENGGQIGYVKWGGKTLGGPFLNVIFRTKKGALSPLVGSGQGYHLFRVDDVRPGRDVSLSEVKEAVRKDFLDAHLTAVVAQARKKAEIEVLLK